MFLYNIDDLQATVRENLARRASEIDRAETIVDEEADKFSAWLRSRGAIPTVVALRQRFEAIRRSELARLDFKLAPLPPDVRNRVDEITHLIIEKLLLTPTERLKSLTDAETVGAYTEALTRLFALPDELAGSSAERIEAAPAPADEDRRDSADGSTSSVFGPEPAERTERRVQPFTPRAKSSSSNNPRG